MKKIIAVAIATIAMTVMTATVGVAADRVYSMTERGSTPKKTVWVVDENGKKRKIAARFVQGPDKTGQILTGYFFKAGDNIRKVCLDQECHTVSSGSGPVSIRF